MIHKHILSLLALLFFAAPLLAQEDLEVDQVEVVKNFDAALIETEKLDITAPGLPVDTSARRYKYSIGLNPLNIQYPVPQIRPIAITPEKSTPGYNGFARLGAGYPIGVIGEAGYHFDNKSNFFGDLYLGHQSANNTKKIENQRYMDNDARFSFAWFTDAGLAIAPSVGYSIDDYYFYGYNQDDTTFTQKEAQRRFSTLDLGLRLFNGSKNDINLDYSGKVDFYSHKDNLDQKETGTLLQLEATKWFAQKHALYIGLHTDLTTFNDTVGKQTLNNFALNPAFTFHGEAFQVKAGLKLFSANEEFSIFPDLYGSVKIIGNTLQLYALFDGALQKNTFRTLSQYNPFITPDQAGIIRNSSYSRLAGGFKGSVKGLNYQIGGGLRDIKDLALFVPDSLDTRRFRVLYDTATLPFVELGINGKVSPQVQLHANANYTIFTLDRELQPWGLPALQVNAGANINLLENKLLLKAEIYYYSGIYTPSNEAETPDGAQLNDRFDVSLGLDYYFTQQFGAFLQLNNLANNQYQRWENYPTFGINIRGGVMARF